MDLMSTSFLLSISIIVVVQATTPGLEYRVKDRCQQYKKDILIFDSAFRLPDNVDCSVVWEKFRKAFAGKDSVPVETDYDEFFDYIQNKNKSQKILFWTGTRVFAHHLTQENTDFVTLEDSYSGSLLNDLSWCGCKSCSDGINNGKCNSTSIDSFWGRASGELANKAAGITHVIVNGTVRKYNAYWRKSYFGRVELPRLGKLGLIKKLVILVAHDLDYPVKESCGNGTIKLLEEDAKKYGIQEVTCQNDPEVVMELMCIKYPDAKKCKERAKAKLDICKKYPNAPVCKEEWRSIGIAFIVIGVCFIFLTAVLLYIVVSRHVSKTVHHTVVDA